MVDWNPKGDILIQVSFINTMFMNSSRMTHGLWFNFDPYYPSKITSPACLSLCVCLSVDECFDIIYYISLIVPWVTYPTGPSGEDPPLKINSGSCFSSVSILPTYFTKFVAPTVHFPFNFDSLSRSLPLTTSFRLDRLSVPRSPSEDPTHTPFSKEHLST